LGCFGVTYAIANFHGPPAVLPGALLDFVRTHLGFFVTVLLCHFLLIFPRRKRVFRKAWAPWVLYLPFFVFFALGVASGFGYPAFRTQHVSAAIWTELPLLILCLVALIHSWITTPRGERWSSGIGWVTLGLAAAFIPFLLIALVGLVVPGFEMPGQQYLSLLGALIPAGLALGVMRGTAPGAAQ
jgi:hypothetical protein